MNKILILAITVLAIVFSSAAFAAPSACKSVLTLPNGAFIYKNSAPLRSGGVGTPIVGFRVEPTLIGVRFGLSRGGTSIYAENGKKIGSCPWTSAHDASGGRYRCTMNTGSLRRAASANGGTQGYFTVSGGRCVKVPHLGKCYGSSKGLCNRTY